MFAFAVIKYYTICNSVYNNIYGNSIFMQDGSSVPKGIPAAVLSLLQLAWTSLVLLFRNFLFKKICTCNIKARNRSYIIMTGWETVANFSLFPHEQFSLEYQQHNQFAFAFHIRTFFCWICCAYFSYPWLNIFIVQGYTLNIVFHKGSLNFLSSNITTVAKAEGDWNNYVSFLIEGP